MNSKSLLIERVYSLELTQRATLVAFYLINRVDSEGTCFPGVKTIAKECNISTRTVQRALNDLEEAGFLKRESRFHEMGGQRSNMYYLQIDEMDRLEHVEEAEVSTQAIVHDEAIDVGDAVGGDKKATYVYPRKDIDYLDLVESIDFYMYAGNNIVNKVLSPGLCQRDGP